MTERERERGEKKFPATMQRKTCPSASPQLAKAEALQDWNLSNAESSSAYLQLHNSCKSSGTVYHHHRQVKQQSECTLGNITVKARHWREFYLVLMLFRCECNTLKHDVTRHGNVSVVLLCYSSGDVFTVSLKSLLWPALPRCGQMWSCMEILGHVQN